MKPRVAALALVSTCSVLGAFVACGSDEFTTAASDGGGPAADSGGTASDGAAPTDAKTASDAGSNADTGAVLCPGGQTVIVPAEQDTQLVASSPTYASGSAGYMIVRTQNGASEALMRFNVPFLANATLVSAHLKMPQATYATNCKTNVTCGSCAEFDKSGEVTLYAARSDWDEGTATWQAANPQTVWAEAGAQGPGVDRSLNELAKYNRPQGMPVDTDLDTKVLRLWVKNGKVSVLAIGTQGDTNFAASTKEEIACDGGAPAAQLTLCYTPGN